MHSSLTTRGRRGSAVGRSASASGAAFDAGAPVRPRALDRLVPDAGLQRWNSSEWQAVRHAVYRTLLDMTVFPALGREGVPLPNALYHSAVEHGLLDAATGQPTEWLLWLNPGLRRPVVPR